MNSALMILFFFAAASAEPIVGYLKHVIVTYRAPEHAPCDYLPELKIAGKDESEVDNTKNGLNSLFNFAREMDEKYSKILEVKDWDVDGWNFGTFSKRTQNAALVLSAGLKGLVARKFNEWTDEDRKKIRYEEAADFLKFQNRDQCPGFFQSLKSVQPEIEKLVKEHQADLQPVVKNYKADLTKPYHFWVAYETFMSQKANKEQLSPEIEAALPGLKKFSEGLLFASTSTEELRRKAGGRLADNIMKDLIAVRDGKPLPAPQGKENVKASFFAAPQDIVAAQLAAFNTEGATFGGKPFTPETFYPEQGAAILTELHYMVKTNSWKVRIIYRKNRTDNYKALVLPMCGGSLCAIDTIINHMKNIRQTKEQLEEDCKAK